MHGNTSKTTFADQQKHPVVVQEQVQLHRTPDEPEVDTLGIDAPPHIS